MTDEDTRIEEALKKCADVHLPDGFADRLVKRILEARKCEEKKAALKCVLARIALVAASVTLLFGFVPGAFDRFQGTRTEVVAQCDGLRAATPAPPQDSQLNALAFLGLCREVVRRRVRSLLVRGRKREDED